MRLWIAETKCSSRETESRSRNWRASTHHFVLVRSKNCVGPCRSSATSFLPSMMSGKQRRDRCGYSCSDLVDYEPESSFRTRKRASQCGAADRNLHDFLLGSRLLGEAWTHQD